VELAARGAHGHAVLRRRRQHGLERGRRLVARALAQRLLHVMLERASVRVEHHPRLGEQREPLDPAHLVGPQDEHRPRVVGGRPAHPSSR
jgi:hypothetical protein